MNNELPPLKEQIEGLNVKIKDTQKQLLFVEQSLTAQQTFKQKVKEVFTCWIPVTRYAHFMTQQDILSVNYGLLRTNLQLLQVIKAMIILESETRNKGKEKVKDIGEVNLYG